MVLKGMLNEWPVNRKVQSLIFSATLTLGNQHENAYGVALLRRHPQPYCQPWMK